MEPTVALGQLLPSVADMVELHITVVQPVQNPTVVVVVVALADTITMVVVRQAVLVHLDKDLVAAPWAVHTIVVVVVALEARAQAATVVQMVATVSFALY
jgi:hypothetical protein